MPLEDPRTTQVADAYLRLQNLRDTAAEVGLSVPTVRKLLRVAGVATRLTAAWRPGMKCPEYALADPLGRWSELQVRNLQKLLDYQMRHRWTRRHQAWLIPDDYADLWLEANLGLWHGMRVRDPARSPEAQRAYVLLWARAMVGRHMARLHPGGANAFWSGAAPESRPLPIPEAVNGTAELVANSNVAEDPAERPWWWVWEVAEKLRPAQRDLILAVHRDGVTVGEYALARGCSRQNIYVALGRAEDRLRQKLGDAEGS